MPLETVGQIGRLSALFPRLEKLDVDGVVGLERRLGFFVAGLRKLRLSELVLQRLEKSQGGEGETMTSTSQKALNFDQLLIPGHFGIDVSRLTFLRLSGYPGGRICGFEVFHMSSLLKSHCTPILQRLELSYLTNGVIWDSETARQLVSLSKLTINKCSFSNRVPPGAFGEFPNLVVLEVSWMYARPEFFMNLSRKCRKLLVENCMGNDNELKRVVGVAERRSQGVLEDYRFVPKKRRTSGRMRMLGFASASSRHAD